MATVGTPSPGRSPTRDLHPLPHLPGRFVGERDGQNRPARHLVSAHQVGDTVGDDAGFAAAGAGQHQEGAFGMLHRLPLAGVQPLRENPWIRDFNTSWQYCPFLRVWFCYSH